MNHVLKKRLYSNINYNGTALDELQELKMGKKSMMVEAISATEKGQTEQAIKILEIITLKEPNNEDAWMQLSKLAKYSWQEAKCLNKVISINSGNLLARQRLELVENFIRDKENSEADLSYPVSTGPLHAIRPKLKIRDSDILPEHDWIEALLNFFFG